MGMKRAEILLRWFAVGALLIALIIRNTAVSTVLTLVCMVGSLGVLYPNLAKLSNISEDNPKAKTLRSVTWFNVAFIAAFLLLAVLGRHLAERGAFDGLTVEQRDTGLKLLMALILAVPMIYFGNAAPQLPFNRYTGLRLPWTVRDEDTWIVAHRVLGYISFPLALLVFANVPTDMSPDKYVKYWWLGAVALWIGIPGVVSAVFYYKKWMGKL